MVSSSLHKNIYEKHCYNNLSCPCEGTLQILESSMICKLSCSYCTGEKLWVCIVDLLYMNNLSNDLAMDMYTISIILWLLM